VMGGLGGRRRVNRLSELFRDDLESTVVLENKQSKSRGEGEGGVSFE
jgi:hypothetical protein